MKLLLSLSVLLNVLLIFDIPEMTLTHSQAFTLDTKDASDDIPEYLDRDKILCQGKGFKVARCINSKLDTERCLALTKKGKKVYVIEIDCEHMKKSNQDEPTDLGEE